MNLSEELHKRLTAKQAEWSHTVLTHPMGKTEFDYGFSCGYHQALGLALNIITTLHAEDEARESNL